jgi:hypothetical protein
LYTDVESAIAAIEAEWGRQGGFLGGLRPTDGVWDYEGCARLLQKLYTIDLGWPPLIDRRLVTVTWNIPDFIRNMRKYFPEKYHRDIDLAFANTHSAVSRILTMEKPEFLTTPMPGQQNLTNFQKALIAARERDEGS